MWAWITVFFFLNAPARAQFTADYQTNIISGVTSNWEGSYDVGSNYVFDALQIINGGVLSNTLIDSFISPSIGYSSTANSNSVLVSGSGSLWNNQGTLTVGVYGSGNSLVITNGGAVYISSTVMIGRNSTANNNSVLVSGNGSVLSTGYGLYLGRSSSRVVINDGGAVISSRATIGNGGGSNNSVVVSGTGSVWNNQRSLNVGVSGSGNSLVIDNGGSVVSSNIVVAPNNLVSLNGGNLIMTDSLEISTNAVLKGSGMIQANLTLAGMLSPGAITNFGNLTAQPGAVLDFKLGGAMQGTEYGFVLVTNGVATLDGLLQVGFINGFETNVLSSDTFTLLTADTLTGSFTNVLSGERLTTANGEGSFLVDYNGNNLVLSDYQAIPEPGTLALCALASFVLVAVRRRSV